VLFWADNTGGAHNPSHSGGRDQEVRSQPRQIVYDSLSQKTLHKDRAGGVAQGVGPEFKPQYSKIKIKPIFSFSLLLELWMESQLGGSRCPETRTG
jgi:hypothetical protein